MARRSAALHEAEVTEKGLTEQRAAKEVRVFSVCV